MSEENTYDKSVRVIRFSGKQADWRVWSLKFLAYSAIKGYKGILTGSEVPVSATAEASLDAGTEDGKRQLKIQVKNVEAYNALILAIDDEVGLGAIESAITEDFPNGNANSPGIIYLRYLNQKREAIRCN